ncbi:post-GPI attachment to proteins factor 3 [Mobula birostris]|uniref:post-GPI attachment to proteins factor 3 n=1 Tax=Mobula birostris TaxID=1983395 RepID=UPI003B27D321
MRAAAWVSVYIATAWGLSGVGCSQGDREPYYRQCVRLCERRNCTGAALRAFHKAQPIHMQLTAPTVCKTSLSLHLESRRWDNVQRGVLSASMTNAVRGCAGGTARKGCHAWRRCSMPVTHQPSCPRIVGGHEEAHVVSGRAYELLPDRDRSPPPPRCTTGTVKRYAACHHQVTLNAWLWSTVFHTRDTALTERMDYFCASAVLLYSTYLCCVRTLGLNRPRVASLFGTLLIVLFTGHIWYLSYVHFDYGYNMAANVCIGLLNMLWWLAWCLQNRTCLPYVWKCALVMVMLQGLALLELLDFPPLLWAFDAHAIWHFSTVPVPFLFYSFLVDDSLHLLAVRRDYRKVE